MSKTAEPNLQNAPILLREDRAGGVCVVTLNRPAARNSLSRAMLQALEEMLADIAADSTCRVVVLAAAGYPMSPRKGDAITGLPPDQPDAMVFHAGTAADAGNTLTSGGRVLCVTVLADSVRQAQQKAYEVTQGIQFDGMQYRSDIGYRAIKH